MKSFILILFISMTTILGAQESVLNPYKYIYINPLNNQGIDNQYGITTSIANAFQSKGFIVANYLSKDIPKELNDNLCLLIRATPIITEGTFGANIKLDIRDNCENKLLYSGEFKGTAMFTVDEAYTKSIKKMVKAIDKLKYSFNPNLTPSPKINVDPDYNLSNTKLNKSDFKKYLTENKLSPIEGIYETFKDVNSSEPYYEIGIINDGDGQFQAIILDSDSPNWKVGEIKMIIERTAVNGVFSVDYFMGNKSKEKTFASLDGALLKIDLPSASGKSNTSIFLKTFPFSDNENVPNNQKGAIYTASGTGFIISQDGLVVTNNHVIENANSIKAILPLTKKEYSLELLQKDELNDIAILKFKDLDFNLEPIPYHLGGNATTGEEVFTIGYPLENIMGENQKISNGIINSLSGVKDDIRFYQISVPIQPGNSGGPLFDLMGNVIGITTASLNPDAVNSAVQNVNYAIKIGNLQNLLSMLPNTVDFNSVKKSEGKELPISLLGKRYEEYIIRIVIY